MTRRYGRSKRGKRLVAEVAQGHWMSTTLIYNANGELGLSHLEVHNCRFLMRHMILRAVSVLFLSRTLLKRTKGRGKKG